MVRETRQRWTIRSWMRFFYYVGRNPVSLTGTVLTTSGAVTLIAFWVYDFLLPGPPHPYIGILLFLILPAIFVLGLVFIPLGMLLQRHKLLAKGELPDLYPEINLRESLVRQGFAVVGITTWTRPNSAGKRAIP